MRSERVAGSAAGGAGCVAGSSPRESLATLRPGQAATVAEIGAGTHSARRLAEMGFVRGANVEMIRAGKPCIVWVNGTRLSVGPELQHAVKVTRRVVAAVPA